VWAGDQRQKLFRNLEILPGDILLSAVTAPGADCLPWDERVCAGLGKHKHSGKLGCRVKEAAAARWNREAPGRWRRLHRRAYQDTVKRFGRGSVFLVARVWEVQARGVLHVWESVQSPSMPRSIIHVSTRLTQKTGCTMRTLRLKRAVFYVWRADLPLKEIQALATVLQAFPGAELVVSGSPDRAPPQGE